MASPTHSASATVPVGSLDVYQYTTSVAPKKIPQPRNSQPSTFIWEPLLCFLERSRRRSLARALDGRDRLLDPVRLPAPLDMRVVRLEGGPLGPDPRDPVEVVPRRRAGRRPFERTAVTPRVFLGHLHPVPPGDVHVPEEPQDGQGQNPRPDGGDDVERGHIPGQERVVGGTPDLALDPRPVLDQECHVEADEHDPELDLADPAVQHLAGHLRPPEVEAGEHLE